MQAPQLYPLFQSIATAVLMLDTEGYIQYANPAAASLTAYPAGELLKKHIRIFYTGKDSLKSHYELRTALQQGNFTSEGWKQKKDGSRFWAETIYSPVYNEAGGQTGYSCLIVDRSGSMKEALELRQQEQRYRLMVEGVKDYAIFLLDPAGHILTWNEGAKRIKGYTTSEIIGNHFSIFYTAVDLADKKPERELKIAVETGKYEEEGWRVKKSGSVFWANIIITALFDDQNQLIGFSKVTRDLSTRREQEELLRQSEERYRSLVEQVTDYGIFFMDEKGRIVSWNEGARKMNGYSKEEIIGKYFSIFYPQEDILAGKPAKELKTALTDGKYEEEGWRIRKDGSLFWASVVITPVYDKQSHLIGYSKVVRDLTERMKAEDSLRESREQYRQAAQELEAANLELRTANQELENFASIASHDLQEPLRAIRSFLQLMEMDLEANEIDELKVYLAKSVDAGNRMNDLIQNLLYYTQLGRSLAAEEVLEVEGLLGEAVSNLQTAIGDKQAEIVIDNSLETISGDRIQLLQLIQNLLSNALKFTDSERPRVKITARRENERALFAVSDNGIGIAEDDQAKIFEIFKRLNTKTRYPGTGIGLAICKKIVERHRGSIWLESEPGKGSTFYFTLNQKPANGQQEEL